MKNIPEPVQRFVCVRDITLRYVDWGDNGPLILLLHGDMRTCRSWDAVARELYPRFHIIAVDARGHGESDWTPSGYRSDDKVEDLASFCEHLGMNGAIGVGHSSGAMALALYAARYSGTFNRLVLLEPKVTVDESFQRTVSARSELPRGTWSSRRELHDFLKRHRTAGRWHEDVIRDVVNHEALQLPDGSVDMKWATAALNWDELRSDYYDLTPVLRGLGLPTLFITSEERRHQFDVLKPVAAETAEFRMVTVMRSGHNMYMERPDAVARAIETFVTGGQLPDAI